MRPLAEGGSGEVFLCREPRLKRLVAVKVLSHELADDPVARVRFEREATAAAALDHPNVVRLYRYGFLDSGVPYLVMQYVDGVTMADRLDAEGPLPVAEVRQVLADVADALAAAHRSGFIHRDVRPDNVLWDRATGRALLADFGLAGLLPRAEDGESRITRAGELLSEPRYASPEQFLGQPPSEGTDVYALGVMGFELLTGEAPFRGASDRERAEAHLRSPPRRLGDLRHDVDPDVADLLERCLAKDPKKRPQASHVSRTLRGPPVSDGKQQADADDLLSALIRRRLPQTVAVTLVAGYAALSFVDQLADRDVLPELAYSLALSTFAFGLAGSAVLAWFHGQTGRQAVPPLEVGLLALLGTGWLLVCLLVVLL